MRARSILNRRAMLPAALHGFSKNRAFIFLSPTGNKNIINSKYPKPFSLRYCDFPLLMKANGDREKHIVFFYVGVKTPAAQ